MSYEIQSHRWMIERRERVRGSNESNFIGRVKSNAKSLARGDAAKRKQRLRKEPNGDVASGK